MIRTWAILAIAGLLAVSVLAGCGPKPQPTTPDEVQVATEPAPVETVAPPVAPPTESDVVETPWWENKDLVALNEEAERQGFSPNVYFSLDESDLKPEAREKLEGNARFLKENPQLAATVEGHCDERGTNEYNLALGERRAETTVEYLGSLGVSGSRFNTISYGEERPVCTESSEACWARNRRAHFILRIGS